MANQQESGGPGIFAVKDCALIAIATGQRAYSLKELRDNLQTIGTDSIYYHFWGGLIEPRFEEREYNNDLAAWCLNHLHDGTLAERLAVVDPTDYADLEDLRQELLELVEERMEESAYLHWFQALEPFEFIRSQIVVFDTHRVVERPEELPEVLPQLSNSSVFYHFIDARRRSAEGRDDFRAWLDGFGDRYRPVCDRIAQVDPYFVGLINLRRQLQEELCTFFEGERT